MEQAPGKVGYWNIDTVDNTDAVDGRCTAHVFDIHEAEQVMTINRIEGGESWAAKTPKISRNGDFHLYSNDIERGMDIFKFTAADRASERKGRWMSPAQATAFLAKAAEGGRDARERARLPAAAGPVVTLRRPGTPRSPGPHVLDGGH